MSTWGFEPTVEQVKAARAAGEGGLEECRIRLRRRNMRDALASVDEYSRDADARLVLRDVLLAVIEDLGT